jgi:hypothetical protein
MGLLFDHFVNMIPLWVYITIAVLAAGALFYFFSPILIPIWAAMPKPLKIALGALGAILAAFVGGRYAGAKTERDLRKQQDASAIKNREEVNREVNNLDRPAVDKRIDKWMRD